MAEITVEPDRIEIRFTLREKILGLVRDQTIPRAAVTEVALENEPLRATTGLRAPGLGIPGAVKIGTWRGRGRRMLVCVRRSEPAVRIEADALGYDAYLVGIPDAGSVVERLGG